MSLHHKFSLLYYLLLDFNDEQGASASETFAALSGMPANYQLFMKGLWYMDRRDYSVGRAAICNGGQTLTFARRR